MRTRTKPQKTVFSNKILLHLLSLLLWMVIWHFAATILSKELLLPTPGKVFEVLIKELLPSKEFWLSVKVSFLHILSGFSLGVILGILLASLSYISETIRIFLWFPIKIIKSIPVASFVILTLLWCSSEKLSVFISFLMVLPILYIHTLEGLRQTDKKLLEMGDVFQISMLKKITYIYLPHILPYIFSASSLAIGMAWKSGIAAEIIGLSKNSIGNQLYQSKIYLMTPELFAWTIVIVVLSIVCEQILKRIGQKGMS